MTPTTTATTLTALALAAVLASGCASERVATRAGYLVDDYCTGTSDADQAAMRERADAATYPHTVRIDCGEE